MCFAKPSLSVRASRSNTPLVTAMPAARSRSSPLPLTAGLGSVVAATTRTTPLRSSAFVHGPVRPVWQHGSSVTYAVGAGGFAGRLQRNDFRVVLLSYS